MNLIIKGIDDFNTCNDCPCYREEGNPSCNCLWDEFSNYARPTFEIDKNCPIIKLKENRHYIDADRLIAFFNSVAHNYEMVLMKNIIDTIESQPDILEVNNEPTD